MGVPRRPHFALTSSGTVVGQLRQVLGQEGQRRRLLSREEWAVVAARRELHDGSRRERLSEGDDSGMKGVVVA